MIQNFSKTKEGIDWPTGETRLATNQDLKELGWIRAEPTDCLKCKHFSCNCYEEGGESFIEDIECEKGNLNIAGTQEGISESEQPNVVCLDFIAKDKSGKQETFRKEDNLGMFKPKPSPTQKTKSGKQVAVNEPPKNNDSGKPAQKKGYGLLVIDGSPSSIARWLRTQAEDEQQRSPTAVEESKP